MTNWLSALSIYRDTRILAITFLGFSSGVPLLLSGSILQAWLTQEDVDLTSIGLFSLVGLPYTLKFLWAPLIDNLRIPLLDKLLGRRRSWLVFLQVCLIGATVFLAFSNPKADLLQVAVAALIVAFASASYDIIVDAFRIEICDDKNMAAGAATYVYGYRVAMWLTGFSSFFIAAYFGWSVSYLVMSGFILVGTVTALLTREPVTQAQSHQPEQFQNRQDYRQWLEQSVIAPFLDFMRKPHWLVIILFTILYKFGDSLAGAMTNPFYIQTGFSLTEIAEIVKTFGTVATFIGLFFGGWLLAATTMYKSLWICGLLQMFSNLLFAAQASIGHDLAFLAITIGIENIAGGMGTAVFVAYLSSLCNISYTATQYALLTSLTAVARTVLVAPAGWLADQVGWFEFFLVTTAAAIPGLVLLWWLSRIQPAPKKQEASQMSVE
ncbi:AmpG family muropeptide MFS transporter [Sneathiella marina]|uniref:AmpG family muropeptide MFS transporter n=1 Tax=Sneathiella marina TaxID=2950108 RepID=A0ABY4W1Z9_9PROT|nr:AmpG family muropeptide MFS transporter [Sneathiella marina]USG61183.1 AmpG family muropeptide MFS transporter [Sneathiella marina]